MHNYFAYAWRENALFVILCQKIVCIELCICKKNYICRLFKPSVYKAPHLNAFLRRAVTTTEGIGSRRKGFHPVQERIATCNGSQCGYCTPGQVMAMYSLLRDKRKLSVKWVTDFVKGILRVAVSLCTMCTFSEGRHSFPVSHIRGAIVYNAVAFTDCTHTADDAYE